MHRREEPAATVARDPIVDAIDRAHHILPDQGPIGVFIHHNTLHGYQHMPFHEGVQRGAADLGARPYLSLPEFASAFARGRIEAEDLDAELRAALGAGADQHLAVGASRAAVWAAWMTGATAANDGAGLSFAVAAGYVPTGIDARAWQTCLDRLARAPAAPAPDPVVPRRHRDALVALGAADPDHVVHAELVRLGAAFLDQGQAHTSMPGRERGFLAAVASTHAQGARVARSCRPGDLDLVAACARGEQTKSIVRQVLDALEVPPEQRESWLLATALALPGWGGMFARLERHPEEDRAGVRPRLDEWLAVRLAYERRAIERACREAGLPVAWPALCSAAMRSAPSDPRLDALMLLRAAGAAQLDAGAIAALPDSAITELRREWAQCAPTVQARLWQEAYERRYRRQILDALAALHRRGRTAPVVAPRAQFVFCIDEREESVRRALEEQSPVLETFGTAGFFGMAIDYLGLDDHAPAPHAPAGVMPGHEVREHPRAEAMVHHDRRVRFRERWHRFERNATDGSRGLFGGAGAAILLGPVAGILAALRVLAPRWSRGFGAGAAESLAPRPATQLTSVLGPDAAAAPRGKPVGFSFEEAGDRVARTLENLGLVRSFAPVVLILGHGSTSLNNPHESAHDCGACGGRRGGANARLFAELANHPEVRQVVARRGISIPASTWFVGGLHDTANDDVTLYDLDAVPTSQREALDAAVAALGAACRESAAERCRRFEATPLGIDPAAAWQHVHVRAASLSQPRPEYGHCTNAVAIVGRRTLTRGLHLDRRAFLVSYDPTIDRGDTMLERILAAVGPVGAGISLEYWFSSVDNEVYGCGTKLPHNVTGLLGVMNGHNGDLRSGLPLQMVEIHEPMRLLLVVEATPASLLAIAARQPEVRELVTNRWVQLVSVDPVTGGMQVLDKEPGVGGRAAAFVPYVPSPGALPEVARSPAWHGATREHLPPALVLAALATETT